MIISYKGKQGVFTPAQQRKIESRFDKLGKLLEEFSLCAYIRILGKPTKLLLFSQRQFWL